FLAEGNRRQIAGLDLGRIVHARRHAVGDQLEQEGFLTGRRCLDEFDDIGGLLRGERQRRDTERGAFGDMLTVAGEEQSGSPGACGWEGVWKGALVEWRLDDSQALELFAIETAVTGDEAIALQQCVRTDEKVRH